MIDFDPKLLYDLRRHKKFMESEVAFPKWIFLISVQTALTAQTTQTERQTNIFMKRRVLGNNKAKMQPFGADSKEGIRIPNRK